MAELEIDKFDICEAEMDIMVNQAMLRKVHFCSPSEIENFSPPERVKSAC